MSKSIMMAAAMLLSVSASAEIIKYDTMGCDLVASVSLAQTFSPKASKKQLDELLKAGADGCFNIKRGESVEVLQRLESVSLVKVNGSPVPLLIMNAAYLSGRAM